MVCFMWGGTKNFCISRELWRLEISAVEEHVLRRKPPLVATTFALKKATSGHLAPLGAI